MRRMRAGVPRECGGARSEGRGEDAAQVRERALGRDRAGTGTGPARLSMARDRRRQRVGESTSALLSRVCRVGRSEEGPVGCARVCPCARGRRRAGTREGFGGDGECGFGCGKGCCHPEGPRGLLRVLVGVSRAGRVMRGVCRQLEELLPSGTPSAEKAIERLDVTSHEIVRVPTDRQALPRSALRTHAQRPFESAGAG